MKVKELINLLERENSESEVIIQKDAEGNGYSPLEDIDGNAIYIPDSHYSGTVYYLKWSADDDSLTAEEWVEMNKKTHCVVLSAVN